MLCYANRPYSRGWLTVSPIFHFNPNTINSVNSEMDKCSSVKIENLFFQRIVPVNMICPYNMIFDFHNTT